MKSKSTSTSQTDSWWRRSRRKRRRRAFLFSFFFFVQCALPFYYLSHLLFFSSVSVQLIELYLKMWTLGGIMNWKKYSCINVLWWSLSFLILWWSNLKTQTSQIDSWDIFSVIACWVMGNKLFLLFELCNDVIAISNVDNYIYALMCNKMKNKKKLSYHLYFDNL